MKNYKEINQGIQEFNQQEAESQREFNIEFQINKMWEAVITEEDHKEFIIEAVQMRASI